MTRHPRAAAILLLHAASALGLAALVLFSSTPPAQAQAQAPTFKIEGSYYGLPNVYEGAEASFKLTRQGIMSAASVTVEVEIWEPNLDDGNGNNPSLRTRQFTFHRYGATIEYFSVPTYVDGVDESTESNHTLKAKVVASDDGSYELDAQSETEFTILDPPSTIPRISITSGSTSLTEGDAATFTLTRTGDTASPLTVQINIQDDSGFTRGNHWDPPPALPISVEFGANSSTATVSLQTLDDHRDVPNGRITVEVAPPRMRPSVPYLPGHTGLGTSASTAVTDNDTAQELELNFGKDGTNGASVYEGNFDKLAIVVKRRQQDADTGNPATFTVRVETDRSGDDWRLDDWTEDTGTGRLYKDYPLEISGSDLQVKEEFTVTFNGESESNWDYWASIKPIEDHTGDELDSSEEAQYWTVKPGFRETTIDATDGGASNGTISIDSDATTVTEGESVVFTLYRIEGPMSKPVTVRVWTWEANRQEGFGVNPSTEYHNVTIEAWRGHAEFTVYPYVDGVAETGADQLIADILSISQVDGAIRYTEGLPNMIDVEINDPPSNSTLVTVAANPDSVVEGGSTTVTFTRTGGDATQPLTVNILIDDPDDRLRGNHWDPAPAIPTQVTFPANSTTQTLTLTFPDDQRDLEPAGLVKVYVLPGTGYYLGQAGNGGTYTTLSVADNDTAQELTFKWGRISADSAHWEQGESYLACDQNGDNCTPGPAEGTFYYDDDRSFLVRHELKEPHPAHFLVSRRAQDTGKTATFVVRVEHNRGWESPRHSSWPTDPETGNRYREFPLTLTGNQRQVVGRIEVLDNGLLDHNLWQYSAEIKRIEDTAEETTLSPDIEAQYWTVNGDRKRTIWPDLTLGIHIKLESVAPKELPEGQDVTITLERNWGNPLESHTVQVRTWEPNQRMADGTNPTDRVHDVVFPAIPMTDLYVEYVTQTETLTVATFDDSVYEPRDTFMAGLLVPSSLSDRILLLSTKTVRILDDDRPTITLSVDDTSITEGDTATFTLTRGNNTANELIVGLSVDDPGGFLEGNVASEAVEVPSSVVFAPGEVTKEVTITPPDDWRDILDNAITFAVAAEPHYDIVGSTSLTVQVADNDVAPQVSIAFNHAEVDEGDDLVLEIRRIGEDKNPLEIPIIAGPVGDEQYHVFGMDAGMSLLTFRYHQPDDSYKGPDHHYTATLQPGRPEFWTPASTATVMGAILDNDPYVVSVEAFRSSIDEGNILHYRVSHNGHIGEPLQVKVNHSENGNAVYDSTLGNQTLTIPAGSGNITPGYITHRNDGYDGDAEFTVELLADDAYEINSSYPSATIIVRNTDPLPVLGFRDTSTTVSEGDGTIYVWVDMLTALPSLMTTTVEYSVNDHFTGDGLSVTQTTGTLTFAPGETSAAIPVEILQNSIAGYKERFHVVLSDPVNAALQDGVANLIHDGVIEDDESVVTLEAQAEAVDEGSDVILTLTRDGDTTDELTVWLQVDKTAPHAENRQDTVVFPAGDANVEHTITTTDDDARNGSHTVTATLLDPPTIGEPRTYWRDRPSSVTVTVRDTNLETVVLLASTLRVAEGESITLELARSGRSPLTVTLEVTETGDYTTGTLPETVTFALQQADATVTIPTQDDNTVEDIGKLTVTLVDGTNYRAGWPNSHTFTIYDNDAAKPSVSVTKDQNWVNEGEPVSFTVTRSTPTDNALQARLELNRVRYRVTQADLDDPTRGITTPENHIHFDTEEITVDFPAGTRTVTVTRQTDDDSLNYGNSTYHATVLNDADDDYVALYNASAKIWVQDDDVPTVTGSSTTSEFFDGFDVLVLPFSRTGDVSGRLFVNAEITHIKHSPAPLQDETTTRSEVRGWRFDPGDSNGISIGSFGYAKALGRGGTLELQAHYCPDNPAACGYYPQYRVGTPSSINFRYYSRFMGVRITRDKASVSEGDAATFTLHRHGGKPDSITRPLQVNVLVTQKGEYISGAAPQTVTFAANQATVTLSVPTTDDGVDEPNGRITVELQYTGVGPEACPPQDDRYCYRVKEYPGSSWYVLSATTAVTDDDYVPPDVSVSDASAGETDGTIEFTVSLDRANIEQAASVDWATEEDGSTTAATGGADFTAASGTLNFAIGETEKTVTVSLLDDQLDEADETFNVVLSNPSELTLADDTGTGTILDDDVDYGIAFSHSTFHTEEGDAVLVQLQRLVLQELVGGVCYITIQGECFSVATEGHTANGAMTVNLDITQTGDFLASTPPTTVTFAQGVALVELALPTVDDSTVEADGSLTVNIPQGAGYSPVYIGPPDSHNQGAPYRTLYLYDNDLAFSIADAQAGESTGQVDFSVSLNAPALQQVTVEVATADGDATSHANVTATSLGQDFEAKTETLTFAAGEQTKTFSVVTLDDTIHERNETFTAQLSKPRQVLNRYAALRWPALTSLADDGAVGTIVDDEQALVASVSRAYSIVNEEQVRPVRFTVQLSHPNTTASERNPAVGWRTVPGTAALGADYHGANGKLTFMPGQNTGFIDVDVVDDNLFEAALETFSVELAANDTRLATISPTEGSFEVSIRDNETLTASISADADKVAEGNDTTFTVTLTGGVPADDVNIPFETSGTATVSDDYAAPKGAITFPPGDASGKAGVLEISAGQSKGTITFPILADGINDDDETLKVEIFSVATDQRPGSVSATDNVATTRILDQDALTVSIEDDPSVTEGAVATFTITLSTVSDRIVSAGWSTKQAGDALDVGETALPDKDYTAASGTVAIPAGDRSATFTVTTTQDTLVENAETFVVVLEEATIGNSSPPEMVPLGVTRAEGTIVDDDTAPTGLTISSISHNQVDEDAGATNITVTVSLDGTTQFTVDTPVTVETIDRPGVQNNATLGVDYTATTANVTIPAGESSVTATITITPVDDTLSEDDEIARLSAKSTVFAGSTGKGVKIVDNDVEPGEVTLTVAPDTVAETASSLQLTVTGTLAGVSSRVIDTVVSLELADDTATAGDDYQAATATLTIPAGEMSATEAMTLEVLDDDVAEGDETLEVTGTVPGTITVTPADVVIEDDDQEPTSISLLATTGPISEGGSAVTIPVRATLLGGGTRSVDTEVALSVLDVSATVTDDYTASWDSSTLTIPAGEYSATANLTLTPVEDTVYEGDEQIAIRGLNSAPGLPVNGVRLTILDNDPKPTTVRLSMTSDTVSEGSNVHFLGITATLEGASTLASDVNLTVSHMGDTQRSHSYIANLLTPLRIEAGQSTGTATLYLSGTDDDVEDEDETVTIDGTSDHPDLTVVSTRLIVANDDTSAVRVPITSLTVREGQRKHYTVALATEPTANVVVTVDVPANAGFTVNPGSVTFTPQSWGRKYIFVEGTHDDDGDDEPPAHVTHSISSADMHYRDLSVPGVEVTIRDDDDPFVEVSFGDATYDVDEGGTVDVTLTLSVDPERPVTVPVTATNQDGASADDYSGVPTNVTFASGETEKTVMFTATQDTENDDGESVKLGFGNLPDRVSAGTTSEATVSITDDDVPEVKVNFGAAAYPVAEGGTVDLAVTLDADPERTVVIPIKVTEQDGASADDYSNVPLEVTIDSGETEKSFAFAATQDDIDDDGESVKLTFDGPLPDGVSEGSAAETTVVIADDDTAGVTISETSLGIEEGDSDTYTVVLDTEPAGDVTVAIGGVTGTDVSLNKTTITFTTSNWDTAQEVEVTAAHDDDAIDEEVVNITHGVSSSVDAKYDGLSAGGVVVTVTDDDTAAVTISETSLEIKEGDFDTYTVVLDTEPAGNVAVTIGGVTNTDLTLDKTALTFTSGNWDTAQTVMVTAGQDDDAVDEDVITITHTVSSTADTHYDGLAAGSVPVTVTDDDTAGLTISETSLEIDEGDSETYTVVLDTEPAGSVTVAIGGIADAELSLDKTTLTFTTGNWDAAQTVIVTADQDDDAVDEEVVNITHVVSSTADSQYDGLAAADVSVTVTDDEVPAPDFTLTMDPPTHGDTDGDGKVNLADTLSYTAVATNTGNVPLANVNVKDALVNPSGADCAELPIGATCTSAVTYTIVQADVDAGSVANTATAVADEVAEKTVARETAVDQVEDLELEKTTTAAGFGGINESIPYSYKVTNTGTVALSGTLEIDDDKIDSGNITCPAVSGAGLAPGGFLTCTGSYTTTQDDVDAGKVTNEATATLGGVTSGSDSVTVNWQAPQGNQPNLTVSSGEDDEDAGSFTFTVTLNPSSLQTVTVDYATGGGTATSGSDYTPASGTLTFSPGDTTKNVTVTIVDDDVDESDETFNLTLSDAANAGIPIPTGTFTIRDEDTAGVTVSDTSLDIDEGDSDTYTVVLDSQPTHNVTITVNDPSNTDVTADPADLTFTPSNWASAQTVTVSASQDNGHDDEDGSVTHTAASTDAKYNGISVDDVLVNVTDDDDVPVTVSFGSATYNVAEGDTVAVKVVLSADPERTVEVPITVTTLDGAESADFSGVPQNVVFNSGDTEKTFDFEAIDDTLDDDGERVRLTFGTLPARVSSASPSQAVVSITDDDVPSVTVSFEQPSYAVAEGRSISVKVILSAQPERAVDVPVSATYLGGVGSLDFLGAPTTLNFGANDTEKTINFSATDDSLDDDGEKVRLGFGNLPAQVNPGSISQATVSIDDNDHPAVTVSFGSASYTVAESDDPSTTNTVENEVSVTIKLSADPERAVTIPVTAIGQDGADASDYSVPNSIVFDASDTEKKITFRASPDAVDDDGESVRLGFGSSLPARITMGNPAETTVSITDDDVPSVTASFEQPSYTVAEGSSVAVKVTLSADPERTVTVPLLKVNQGGASSSDYSGVPQNAVFNSGDTEKTFDFEAASDNVDDDGESVRVSFGNLPDQVSSGTYSGTTVSITDDDVPSVTVSFEEPSYTVAEGNSVTVKVVLSADPERTLTVPITATGQGGATASDYSVPSSVVFNDGDTEKEITFSATQDTVDDDGESVKLGFGSSLPAGVTEGSRDETTVSITDDDVPSVTVSFEQPSYTVAEGNSVIVKVILSTDPERTVTIPLLKVNQGGASSADYSVVPQNVVFNSGDTEKTFNFAATDDSVDDDGESVKFGFGSSLPSRVLAGTPAETTVSITDDDVPAVTVSFEQSTYTVAEGSSETVKVKLSADPERTIEVPISVTNMDGASSSDYSIAPQTVVFNSGDTEKTFAFSATEDTEDDDGERVRLNFGNLPPRVSSTGPSQTVVSITDNDVPSVTVSFEQPSYTVGEGNSVTVKVVLSADPERTVTIPLTKSNQGGATASDYSVPGSVVFNSGDTEKTVSFSATQDAVDDDGESVKLGFGGSLPAHVTAGTPSETTVSITDDDVPSVTVSFEEPSYTVAEGNTVAVKAILSADPERTVTIPLTKSNQGGATASDYSVPTSVAFNSGDTEKTVSFSATQDAVDDDDESVKLGFGNSLPTGVTEGSTDETTISITDDDAPSVTVSFEESSYAVAEGDNVTVKVTLSADPERTVTIPITATGQGGVIAADYSVPTSVVFNSGDTEKTVSFSATQDAVDDDGESVKLGFGASLPAGVSEGSTDETTVSITDDDVPSVTVSFEETSYTVAEGNSVAVKVVISADPERTVTIPLTKSNQGGASASDYSVPTSVVFNSGDTEKTVSFSATQDTVDDDGESVKLGFQNLPTRVSAGTTDETTVTITDDDVPSVTVSFEEASYAVAEGNTVAVKVTLSADPERTVTIPLTKTNQGGASASDYSVPSSVVFNSGHTEKTVNFSAAQDTVDDDGESVKLGLGSPLPAGVTKGSTDETTVSITDDDVPSVTVSFEQPSYTVAEGNSVAVKVILSADPERTVTIPLTKTNQGGASASDYGVPSNVVFNSGDTEKTVSFSATQDTVDDDGESVKLGFGASLPTGVTEGSTDETTVTITDDDVPSVTASFEETSYTVAEGNSVAVKVTLSADPERTVTIPLTKTNQGGASASDYSVPSSVVFNSGDTEKTANFSATQDTVNDDGESVKLGFGNSLPSGVTVGSTDETTVSITDDDVPSVTVSFEETSYTVAEGNSVAVKVVLSADPERTVTIPLTKTGQGGASASDYSVPSSVVFNSGDTEKTVSFSATQDTVDDDGESVKLGLGSPLPAGVTKGSTDETVVSITDDDVPSVTVSFEQDAYDAVEGESVTVTVTLSADPERTVTIPITATNQGGATASDYSVPSSVVFNSGDTEKTFDFEATDDEEEDDDESVKFTFGGLPTAVSEGTTNQTVVSIIDTDGGREGVNKEIFGDGVTEATISFEQSSYTTREGSTTTVKVMLSAEPQASFSIPLTATSGTGLTSGDYSGVPANLDFTSGDVETSFIVTAVQDQEDENNETLTLGFGTLLAGLSSGDNSQAVVTIVDSVHVSFGSSSYQAYEGGVGAQVVVKLDSPAPFVIVVPITAAGMNGATSADWTGVPSNVTFATGDTQKSFIVMAYDDLVEDDGESVELRFGNLPAGVAAGAPSVATVELMNMEVPTCGTAVWCATVEFADAGSKDWKRTGLGLGYHTTQEPYLRYSSLSDNRFTFRGKEYQVWSMFTTPGMHPDVVPGSPGRIPEYSTFSIHILEVVGSDLKHRVDRDHQRDWTLYVDGIALPFTDAAGGNGSGTKFIWHHPELQNLFANWTDGDTYEIMIAEDPVDDRPEPPETIPTAPKYLRVIPGDGSLVTIWMSPHKDGNSAITHYRLQWKLATESWGNPNAVEEVTVQPPGGKLAEVYYMISGLSNYTRYTLRVIAVNGAGDSEPSAEHFGMPQRDSLDIVDTVVNGNQLTITYERTLDGSSVPSRESFRVLVNGAPRNVTGASISGRSVILTLEEPAKRAIRATDEVEFLYLTPPSGAPAIKDTAGNYASSCEFGEPPSEARNETDRGLLESVSAEFTMVPASHRGPGSEVVFRIVFSEPVRVDIGRNYAHLLDVEGGKVTSAWWLDGDTTIWEIVLEPDDDNDIKVSLPADRPCDAQGAPCASGARRLATALEHTITGDDGPRETRSVKPNDTGDTGKEGKDKENTDEDDPGRTGKGTKSEEPPVNTPAVGTPAVSGEPRVGEKLTADTSGIVDADGMDQVTFSYQWIAGGSNIDGATGSSYDLTEDEEGLTIQVQVGFSDDAGNEESLTSEATGPVLAAPAPLTVSLENAPASHNGTDVFTFGIRFSEEFKLSFKTLRDHVFTVDGGTVKKAQRQEKGSNIGWTITVKPDSDAAATVALPATTDCDAQGAICADDGRKLIDGLEFTVSGPGS